MRALLLIPLLLLTGCVPSMEEFFGKARETQAVAEQKVDTLVREVLSFTCDLDVKRLNKLSNEEPGFKAFFWERCGPQYGAVIDGAIDFRNSHPVSELKIQ